MLIEQFNEFLHKYPFIAIIVMCMFVMTGSIGTSSFTVKKSATAVVSNLEDIAKSVASIEKKLVDIDNNMFTKDHHNLTINYLNKHGKFLPELSRDEVLDIDVKAKHLRDERRTQVRSPLNGQ